MNDMTLSKIVESVVRAELKQKSNIDDVSLALAKEIIKRVQEKAKQIGVNAVVAVSNTAARPVAIECMDNSYIASFDVALNKAYTVVALKMSTKELKELSQPGQSLYGIQFTNEGKIVIFGGGVPIMHNGKIIGGLGVSGGTEEQDTMLADFGGAIVGEAISCL